MIDLLFIAATTMMVASFAYLRIAAKIIGIDIHSAEGTMIHRATIGFGFTMFVVAITLYTRLTQ